MPNLEDAILIALREHGSWMSTAEVRSARKALQGKDPMDASGTGATSAMLFHLVDEGYVELRLNPNTQR
jgi:hypothetical protein